MLLTRDGYRILPEGDNANVIESAAGLDAGDGPHQRRFLEALRSRKAPACGIREGHISTASLQLANISYRTGRKIFWNEARQQIAGDPEASRYLALLPVSEIVLRGWRPCSTETSWKLFHRRVF